MKALNPYSRIAVAFSALVLISAYYVPLWQILMWAPQYPEGLTMKIWISDITGDVRIISALNHYIGMRQIEVSMFPEFGYMIYVVGGVIVYGLLTAVVNRRAMLLSYLAVILGCGLAALIDFYLWGYDYGHNLDPSAPIVVPGMSYQPPLVGTKQLLNFTAFSGPDTGGWIFIGSAAIMIAVTLFEFYRRPKPAKKIAAVVAVAACCFAVLSCTHRPEPLVYGRDTCHFCKMTLMDDKFGAEVISVKGKIFKFDDTSCLIRFLKTGELQTQDVTSCLITDFASPGTLVDAKSAMFLFSQEIRSPMAANVAAFSRRSDLEHFNSSWRGTERTWDQLFDE